MPGRSHEQTLAACYQQSQFGISRFRQRGPSTASIVVQDMVGAASSQSWDRILLTPHATLFAALTALMLFGTSVVAGDMEDALNSQASFRPLKVDNTESPFGF